MPEFGFCGPAYTAASVIADAQQAVNLYLEKDESGAGKSKLTLYGTPGTAPFCTLPAAPIRGLFVGEERMFAAAGSHLYEISAGGGVTDRGEIGNDGSPVQMFPNGQQLFIVSNKLAWIDTGTGIVQPRYDGNTYEDLAIDAADTHKITSAETPFEASDVGTYLDITGGAGFTVQRVQITAVDGSHVATTDLAVGAAGSTGGAAGQKLGVVTAVQGAFLDGYFIAQVAPDPGEALSNKKFAVSKLYDGLHWDPLDYGIKEGYPDALAAILADHEELWLFGTQTTEVWRNEGSADFPFRRDPSGFIHQGCRAPWTPTSLAGQVFWLGGDARSKAVAWRAQGFQPQRVSTHAVEQAWNQYARVDDAEAYGYIENGHAFWVISFPSADATWCYDVTTQSWHQRASWDGSNLHRHRSRWHAFVFGKHYVSDYETGDIYESSVNFYSDNGADIRRVRAAPHIANENTHQFHHFLQLDMEVGVGEPTSMTLAWSNDGGHTWTAPVSASAGANGDYFQRVIWRRLGKARDRVYKVTITGQTKVALANAYVRITQGTS